MSNKKIFNEIFNTKFNQQENYSKLLEKIKKKREIKELNFAYKVIPVCLIILILSYFMFINKSNNLKPTINDNNQIIYINKIKEERQFSLDAVAKKIDTDIKKNSKWNFDFIENIKIPNELNFVEYQEIYTRDGNDKEEYDILHDYVIFYGNSHNKLIKIFFSINFKPLRDYYFDDDNLNKSIINNTELFIGRGHDYYIVEFTSNNINFNIQTDGITEDELIELLESIIS